MENLQIAKRIKKLGTEQAFHVLALAKEMEEIFVPQRATIKDSAKVPNTRRQENFDRSVLSGTRESKFSDNTVDGTFAESSLTK